MQIFGLTGGIGSGKSTVARLLAERGIPVIDADRLGHEVLAPGGSAEAAVRAAFGEGIVRDGAIDRERLAALVFDDEAKRQTLNRIVHPAIFREISARCIELAGEGHGAVVVEAALLAENGEKEPFLARLILVVAGAAVRTQRLLASRTMSAEEIARRMRAQTPPERKVPAADWVIENNGDLGALSEQVGAIATEILAHV